ncbi:hypothetical protein B7G68_16905 [Caulobacter segnis]|uniref:DUF4398 domain-containing protein n=2 Tax=Caulobacter segnis TaxID=88688 RepID=D5VML4_CAUST|nr:hypothetical protein [Caulobacter segnis]ADG11737.1 hypothetical protein Cseg_3302 [Caulobacter segnis ATCC 21756]AVQ03378.1 hypothetical protein B7G68_16905 [Caulobacter segnis]
MTRTDFIARRGLAAVLLSTSLLSAGCATVQSLPKDATRGLDRDAEGLTYFLPKKLAKLTITREPVDPEELAEALKDATVALKAAKADQASKKSAAEGEQALLDQLASDASARSSQTETAELAKAARDLSDIRVTKAKAAVDAADKAYRAALQGARCAYASKLELLPAQADVSHRYVAQLRHNWLRDDTVKLAVTPAGLLSSSNVVAADRTGDILVEIAGAVAGWGGGGGRSSLWSSRTHIPQALQPDCGEPRTIVQIFDPADASARAKVAAALKKADYPFRVGPISAKDKAAVAADPSPPDEPSTSLDAHSPDKTVAEDIFKADRGAIFYRSPLPVTLTLEQRANGDDWQVVDAVLAQLPQAGPISYIPANSSAFVKTVDDVVFTDGVIASWSPERPSEVLEVVRLPIKIATAIISVPAQILSLRVDYSSKGKALADQQAAEIASAKTLSKLQKCLKDAEAAGADGLACLPPAP